MSETEKKGTGKTKIGLGISIVLLIVSLIANAWLYTQVATLESNYDDYKSTHHYTDSQYHNLEAEKDSLRAPKLRGIGVTASDNRPWFGTPYLDLHGYFCNVGTDTASNAKLYIEAFQGNVLVFNTSIVLGTIEGEDFVYVDEELYYQGESLTAWHVWTVPSGYNYYRGS